MHPCVMCVARRCLTGVRTLFLQCGLELRWSTLAESAFLHSHLSPWPDRGFAGDADRTEKHCNMLEVLSFIFSCSLRWLGPKLLFCCCFIKLHMLCMCIFVSVCYKGMCVGAVEAGWGHRVPWSYRSPVCVLGTELGLPPKQCQSYHQIISEATLWKRLSIPNTCMLALLPHSSFYGLIPEGSE